MRLVQECPQREEFLEVEVPSATDPDVFYVVTIAPWDRGARETVCECPSYEHRGYCRHQIQAFEQICTWTELDGKRQTAEQAVKRICPECGKRTQIVVVDD